MKINFEVAEPWDLPEDMEQTVVLQAPADDGDDSLWHVQIVAGWERGEACQALLSPRYKGHTLSELREGRAVIVNLVVLHDSPDGHTEREMLIGKAVPERN